ncbi:hypothetical protein [Pelagicoccus sp. SDUM812005]|uniref:hypothetical protein n=1 Tax=Pelagicoccus sp. SDUM812005 TaxID=3041257 RepID=UPI00280F7EB4|nr:hypothetical protein [Pelagicoccus sp. SDUM812005]MDQ8182672.1 hypothetical protein [Pelagicoccus sp. SDUM812005]
MKKAIITFLIFLYPSISQAVTIELRTIIAVAAELKDLFGDTAPTPIIETNDDPCSLTLSINNLRGPYGNYTYSEKNIAWNQYWQGSLVIEAAEGFVKKDRLEISGTVQHRDEFCHENLGNPGPPLSFLFNLDLNTSSIANLVNEQGQITLNSPLDDGPHLEHHDFLTRARLRGNVFDEGSEIGQVHLSIAAVHVSDSVSTIGLLGACLLSLTLATRRLRLR